MKTITIFLAMLALGGCALVPNHVTVGVGSATHALTGEIKGPQPFISATYDLRK